MPKACILAVIVLAQFCCTSLWFAGNAVMGDLVNYLGIDNNALGHTTSAVQFGFILGTLVFAIFLITDRFSPSKVFFVCALLGAFCNLGITMGQQNLVSLLVLRALTGFFLAGIYPVGMKIATDYYQSGLGQSLGFLVGALVLGTAFPHVVKSITTTFTWSSVIIFTSILAILGGVFMLLFVPDGPYRTANTSLDFSSCFKIFNKQAFRKAALGYFGHMWELYAFWAFVPLILKTYLTLHPNATFNIPLLSFFIIASGALGCVLSGYLSINLGTKRVATSALILSGVCCLLSPLLFYLPSPFFIGFLLFWGVVVVADSPLFSTLVAQNADDNLKGSALTLVNCIGFGITIISIQLINSLQNDIAMPFLFILLAIGPLCGTIILLKPIK